MSIEILLPVRHHHTSDLTDLWEVTVETCVYINRGFLRNVYKLSILGFGFRIIEQVNK